MASAVIRKTAPPGIAILDAKCRGPLNRPFPSGPSFSLPGPHSIVLGRGRLLGTPLSSKSRRLRAARIVMPWRPAAPIAVALHTEPRQHEASGQPISSVAQTEKLSGSETEARGPSASSSEERPRTNVQAAFLKRLPKILSLAALCILLLPSRAAWATSGSIAHPARFSLPTTVSSLKEAFRVASPKELLASAWTGLVAGCLHTLTGPDHLAALAPMSIGRTRLQSAWMGALWGCGHDAGQLLFGLLFLLLKDRLHMDLLSQWSGVVIGVTLCGIGALGLHESRQLSASPATSSTEEPALTPAYTGVSDVTRAEDYQPDDAATSAPKATASSSKPFGVATFITGIFHGFQPDALIMILPALALPSKLAGLSFLVTFLLGTILAMGSYTACIGASCEMLGERVPWINEKLSQVSSSISILVGIALISSNAFGFKVL